MSEEKKEEQQPNKEETGASATKEPKPSAGRRITMAISEMYGLIKKPKPKIKKPDSRGKPAVEGKKSSLTLPTVFNVQKINLRSVNQVLVILLVVLIGLMFYVTFRPGPDINAVMTAVSKIKYLEIEPKEITPFQELSHYLEQIRKRDIFREFQVKPEPVVVAEREEPPPPPPEPKVPIEQKAKNFKLIGISWGDNPKAIIRDMSSQVVHFVSEGQTIEGTELTIKEVLKEEVILTSEDEEMSLL